MGQLPLYISLAFIATTLSTLFLLFLAAGRYAKILLIITGIWLLAQMGLGLSGFYTVTTMLPPRFLLAILPPLLVIILFFITKKGRSFLDNLNSRYLTLIHIVRIPVELVLFLLFLHGTVPELMTFKGRNLDILSGLTAPFVYYWGYVKRCLPRTVILVWNVVCLTLLFHIVWDAVLSAPFPFQRFAFDQPNVAILYFPFIWLPCCIVPVVLGAHLVCIRQLLRESRTALRERAISRT